MDNENYDYNEGRDNGKFNVKKTAIIIIAVVFALIIIHFLYSTCVIVPHKWTEATCTEPKTCERCGETEGKALGHSYSEYTVVKEPTCTEKGSKEAVCSVCGSKDTEDIPMTEHTYSEFTIVKNPTCTEKGKQEAVCSVCGDKKTEDIPMLGHKLGEWEIAKEATYYTQGKKVQKCTVCGEIVNSDNYELSADEKLALMYSIYDVRTEISSGSYVYIYFKVKNNTSVARTLHITGTLYDANNSPMTSAGTYINNLPSGQFREEYVIISCSEPFSYYDLKVDEVI